MANQIYLQPVILSAFGATTTDVVVDNGYLTLGNATKYTPKLYMPNSYNRVQKSLVETPVVNTVAYTVANSTTYAFNVIQYNRSTQNYETYLISYTSDATALDAEIATGLTAAFNAMVTNTALNANIAGAATPLTVYGGTADPIIQIQNVSNITIDTTPTTTTTAVAPEVAIVSSTNATPIVVTTAATTWAVGQSVTIASHAVNTAANGTWRVRATNGTTTITLEYMNGADSVGNGIGGATGTVVRNGQNAVGSYAQVAAVPNTNGTAVAGATYTTVTFNLFPRTNETLTEGRRQSTQQVVYMDEVTAAANFLTNLAGLNNVLNGLDNAGTVANPELIATVA